MSKFPGPLKRPLDRSCCLLPVFYTNFLHQGPFFFFQILPTTKLHEMWKYLNIPSVCEVMAEFGKSSGASSRIFAPRAFNFPHLKVETKEVLITILLTRLSETAVLIQLNSC